jgi:methylmalonyl-CoA mutase N-terminal domain/subunit
MRCELLAKIEAIGLVKAVQEGTVEAIMDDYNYKLQGEMDRQERIIVGVNKFQPKEEPAPKRFKFDQSHMASPPATFQAIEERARRRRAAREDRRCIEWRMPGRMRIRP